MPKLQREVIEGWLVRHNWFPERLAAECTALSRERADLGDDDISTGVMKNAVYGLDPMNSRRIHLIVRVTEKFGDPLTYEQLVAGEPPSTPGTPPQPPPAPKKPVRRKEKTGKAPKRELDRGAA